MKSDAIALASSSSTSAVLICSETDQFSPGTMTKAIGKFVLSSELILENCNFEFAFSNVG